MATEGEPLQGQREPATHGFLFADLRGYTDYVERHGDDAGAKLLERYRRMVREVVARHTGAEVRTEGDSFYVVFPSASRAVVAGLEIVSEAVRESAEHPEAPIRVGVGIHAGETADTAEGPVGSAVNLAARICAQAQAGEVLVSDTVRGLTRTRQVGTYEALGTRRLKGIAEPVAVYRVVPPGTGAVRSGRTATRLRMPVPTEALLLALIFIVFPIALYVISLLPGGTPAATQEPTRTTTAVSATGAPSATPTITDSPTPTPFVPTGTRIVYSRQVLDDGAPCDEFPRDAKLYVIDPDHAEQAPYRLTYNSNLVELDPAWSADGSRIAFVGSILRGPGGISWVGTDGENATHLLAPRTAPAINFAGRTTLTVAPDGSAVVHAGEDMIWRTASGDVEAVQIAGIDPDEQPEPTEFYRDVTYRADGKLLVLGAVAPDDTSPWLAVMSDDGSSRQALDLDLAELTGRVSRIGLGADDDLLALEVEAQEEEPRRQIFVGRISRGMDDFRPLPLTLDNPRNPRFSPDGKQLVVQAALDGRQQLFTINVANGEATQLTNDAEASACLADWRAAPANLTGPRPPLSAGEVRPFELGRLEAATYRDELLDPDLELTFGDGWYARRNYVDGFSVYKPGVAGEVDFARLQVGPSDACGEGEPVLIGNRPSDLMAYLDERDDLDVGDVGPTNLGGYTGLTVAVTGREGQGCRVPGEDFEFWALWPSGEDSFSLGPDEHLQLTTLDVRGTTVSFLVFVGGDTFDEYRVQDAQPLLRTVTFPEN